MPRRRFADGAGVENIAKDLAAGKTTKSAPAPSETRMDELLQKFGTDATVRA